MPQFQSKQQYQSIPGQFNPVSKKMNTIPAGYAPSSVNGKTVLNPIGTGQVLSMQAPTGGGSNSGYRAPVPAAPDFSGLNQQTDAYQDLIEQEYNNSISRINNEESSLRNQAGTAQSQVETDYFDVLNQLRAEQATKEEGVQSTLATGEKESTNQIQNARDLYRQMEQRNIAQLAGLGISSSSVAEGLGERLSVETARRMSGITNSQGEMRINATKELARVKDHFASATTNFNKLKANKIAEVNNSLLSGLQKLQSARNETSTAKQRGSMDLWVNAQNQVAQIQADYEKLKQAAQDWANKKATALIPLSVGDYNAAFETQMAKLQQQYDPSQFDFTINDEGVDTYGRVNRSVQVKPKKKDDENNSSGSSPLSPDFWNDNG